jgi:RimJ/RimL family protein N-acetyltransferase
LYFAGEQGNLLSCFVWENPMSEILETERLLLRPLKPDDGPRIAAAIDDYEIAKNLSRVPFPYHLSDAEEFLAWAMALDDRSAFRVIELKHQPSVLIGLVSYDWVEDKQISELGYWLVQDHWGKGLMTEAVSAMVDLAFTVSDLENLASSYFDENPASGRVLAHAGFEVRGRSRHVSRARGTEMPVTNMGLSRQAWRNKKAAV